MILEKQTEANIHQEGESQDSIGMSLDLDSAQVLMQMLSKNLYSDSVGSTVRECASNALDSHRRAGTTDPIIVSFQRNKDNNYEFSVEDFGTGLDADDVKNIISKYGKSTKRNSSTELGMMGLGFKAPLAYSSSFYFTCRKDGMERKYMMYEGEDTNTIDLLYETPTTEHNGVKVIVPVKYHDARDFREKIPQQLAYFESVYFDVEGIDNNFTIHRHELFQFSPMANDNYLHICLDNVYYPMDFSKLGIDSIYLPIGLRFSLTDGLFPTPNRESIRYTKEAKEVILKRIAEAADYFVDKYNESIKDSDDPVAILNFYHNSSRYVNNLGSKSKWDINPLKRYTSKKFASPNLKSVSLLDMERMYRHREYILGEYESKFQLYNDRMSTVKSYWAEVKPTEVDSNKYYVYSDKIPGIKKDYLKSSLPRHTTYNFLKKKNSFVLGSAKKADFKTTYYGILNLGSYPKSQWRQLIQEFQYMLGLITKNFINLDALQVPDTFIQSRKKVRIATGKASAGGPRRIKLKGEMVCKQAVELERWVEGKSCKWVSKIYDMSKFHQNKFILVYGKQEDTEKMDKWFKVTRRHNIELAILSERELKIVENIQLHNLISFSKFMEGKTKAFQRLAMECLADQFYDTQKYVFENREALANISTDLYNKIGKLAEYKKNMQYIDDDVRNIIVEHATQVKAFDPEVYHIYKEVKLVCEKLSFLNAMMSNIHRYRGDVDDENPMVQALIDLFKYHRHRLDWKNYNIRLNEDLPLEQTLTTETVEELVNQD
jgi:hypothetical protein